MKPVHIRQTLVHGLSVRTSNADEMSPESAKIGTLWHRFCKVAAPTLDQGTQVFGVYFDYESDASGPYSLLAGSDQLNKDAVEDASTATIEEGDYLVFSAQGEMPQIVIETWKRILDHFDSADSSHQRAYTTDFELYPTQDTVEIHIAVVKA